MITTTKSLDLLELEKEFQALDNAFYWTVKQGFDAKFVIDNDFAVEGKTKVLFKDANFDPSSYDCHMYITQTTLTDAQIQNVIDTHVVQIKRPDRVFTPEQIEVIDKMMEIILDPNNLGITTKEQFYAYCCHDELPE